MSFWKKDPPTLPPDQDPTSLGRLLVDAGALSQEALDFALQIQAQRHEELLGNLLVDLGLVDPGIVESTLVMQMAKRGNGRELSLAVDYARVRTKDLEQQHQALRAMLLPKKA
jgi:hypothetical protein